MTPVERFRAAVARHRAGDCAGAAGEYRALLDAFPDDVNARFHLGLAEHQLGQLDAAALAFRHTLRLAPDFAEAWQSLAAVEFDRQQVGEACEACHQALAIRPGLSGARRRLADALLADGSETEALALLLDGLRLTPGDAASWRLLDRAIDAVARSCGPAALGDAIPADFLPLVAAARAAGVEIKGAAINGVLTNVLRQRLSACGDRSLGALQALGEGGFATLEVLDRDLERQLTTLRRAALEAFTEHGQDRTVLHGALAGLAELACLQFRHEYVAAVSPAEQRRVDALAAEIGAGLAAGHVDPVGLAVYACYRPLFSLLSALPAAIPAAERLCTVPPAGLERLCRLQLHEPLTERGLAGAIPRLTPVVDATSRRVASMYEENPYPRWQQLPIEITPAPSLAHHLAGRLPGIELPAALRDPAVEVLIAGGGTGRQVVALASLLPNARILAVDLSLPSLCYARRKLDERGMRAVRLGQADLLALADLPGRFPYIECLGVLHHLAKPIDGLRVLVSCLAPGGILMLALYSQPARQHFGVLAAQQFARTRGFPPTPDGIRQCRVALEALEADDAPGISARFFSLRDYYFLSQCRDLIFHEMEHCYTVPELGALCAAAGLEFIGFDEPAPGVFADYSARFPDDPARIRLDYWAQYEAAAPETFIGMYTFYARKPA